MADGHHHHDHHHHDHDHDHHHHDHHDRSHGHRHRTLWLATGGRVVHRVGRRQFLTDLGRGAFAIAVLGACSGDDATADPSGADVESGDAATAAPPSAPSVSAGATPTDADTPTAGAALKWAQVELGSVSAYVLVRGNEAAVVDTGSSGSADQIGAALATLGVTFDDVRHVVLTHHHPDHIGSLPAVIDRAPWASAYAGTLDVPNITAPVTVTGVGDGDDVFGLNVIDTPGHTPGSISVLDPGIGLLIAGDALTGNDDGTGLSGPNERFTDDLAVANVSVGKLAGFDIESIGMGHGEPVTAGAGSLLQTLASTL